MKIDSSTIHMDSVRFHANSTQTTLETMETNLSTGMTRYSGTSFTATFAEFSGSSKSNAAGEQYDTFLSSLDGSNAREPLPSELYTNQTNGRYNIADVKTTYEKFQEEFIKRLEELMDRIRDRLLGYPKQTSDAIVDITSVSNQPGAMWTRTTVSYTHLTLPTMAVV